jgi:hypothetical protein
MDIDPNPPQSLAEIIQQRMDADATAAVGRERQAVRYRRAVRNGVVAGLLVMLLVGLSFLLKSLI